jgi:short-subunit dehydrogenase
VQNGLKDAVVVVTGASSGIGRAAAIEFARQGASVVLAARREEVLREVAEQCESNGGKALVVPTDVSDQRQVDHLAEQARQRMGRIDVWVNNAAVALFGRFDEVSMDIFRRVIETNFFGYVYGARAAMPIFREQGSGTLINVSSVVGTIGQPYTSAYVSSKWAIRGLSESLRMELSLDEAKDIHVCTVLPGSIDTPLFHNAGNFTGRAVQAMPPVYSAQTVAETIVQLATHPKREVPVGSVPRMLGIQHAIARGLTEEMTARGVDRSHFQDRPADPTRGNLFEPLNHYDSVSGDWGVDMPGRSSKFLAAAVAVALGVLGWKARKRKQRGDGLLPGLPSRRKRQGRLHALTALADRGR